MQRVLEIKLVLGDDVNVSAQDLEQLSLRLLTTAQAFSGVRVKSFSADVRIVGGQTALSLVRFETHSAPFSEPTAGYKPMGSVQEEDVLDAYAEGNDHTMTVHEVWLTDSTFKEADFQKVMDSMVSRGLLSRRPDGVTYDLIPDKQES